MSFSFIQYVGDGATTLFSIPFPYIFQTDVTVKVNGTLVAITYPDTTHVNASPAPAVAAIVEVRRNTAKTSANVVFADGSVLGKNDLNADTNQLLYIAQEAFDATSNSPQLTALNQYDALSHNIINVADPLSAQDAATKNYADTKLVAAGNVTPPGGSVGTPGFFLKALTASTWGWVQAVAADIFDATTFGKSVLTAASASAAGLAALAGATFTGAINEAQGADIASAATVNLDTATGNLVNVTGTVGITAITLSQGRRRKVQFTGVLTLTNGASLALPGGANITTAAGDFAEFEGYAAGVVKCSDYSPASGKALVATITKSFTSTQQVITSAGALALAHSLGVQPNLIQVKLHCTTAENGYSVGDELIVTNAAVFDGTAARGASIVPDATNLNVRYGSSAACYAAPNKGTGVVASLTNANWTAIFMAWA